MSHSLPNMIEFRHVVGCRSCWFLVFFTNMSASGSSDLPSAEPRPPPQVIQCTEELSRALHALRPKKKQKRNPKLNTYSNTSKLPSGIQQRQHTQYQVRENGSISFTRSFIEPPRNAQPTTQPATPAIIPNEFNGFLADESWDVEMMPLDDGPPVRRRRAAGVSPIFISYFLTAE
jgi:hypothetical protein